MRVTRIAGLALVALVVAAAAFAPQLATTRGGTKTSWKNHGRPRCSGSSNATLAASASASQPASRANVPAFCLQPCNTTISGADGFTFPGT